MSFVFCEPDTEAGTFHRFLRREKTFGFDLVFQGMLFNTARIARDLFRPQCVVADRVTNGFVGRIVIGLAAFVDSRHLIVAPKIVIVGVRRIVVRLPVGMDTRNLIVTPEKIVVHGISQEK